MATGKRDLAGKDGASRASIMASMGAGTLNRALGSLGLLRSWGHTVVRGCVHRLLVSRGNGYKPALGPESAFHPAQLDTHYNSAALPGSTTAERDSAHASGAVTARTFLAFQAPFSIFGIRTFSRRSTTSGTWRSSTNSGRYHLPDWIRRSARNPPDGAVLVYPERIECERPAYSESILDKNQHFKHDFDRSW